MLKFTLYKEHYFRFKKILHSYRQKILSQRQNLSLKNKFKKIYKTKLIKKISYNNLFLKMKKRINKLFNQKYKKGKKKSQNNKIYAIKYKKLKPKNMSY